MKECKTLTGLPTTSVAIVHDWLTAYVGGERVLEQILRLFPDADLFSAIDILPPAERSFLGGRVPRTSFAQNLPFIRRNYRHYLPLLMLAIEQLDVSESELVLSSSSAIGKGVLTGPDQLHVAYVHSPMRYAWDMQHQYLRDAGLNAGPKGLLAQWLLHKARLWDGRTANGVDFFIANSEYIARRIWKVYRRPAEVIYPPVDLEHFRLTTTKDDYYLTASRLVPYKKVPTIVEAFRDLPDRKLVVVGDGSDMQRVKAQAGQNVEVLGYQSSDTLRQLMSRARAFIFAAEEDFGISPVEAQACGTPVIAFGRGGVTESVRGLGSAQPTGVFFDRQTPATITSAVRQFEAKAHEITPEACRENAERFATQVFTDKYAQFLSRCWDAAQHRKAGSRSDSTGDAASWSALERDLEAQRYA